MATSYERAIAKGLTHFTVRMDPETKAQIVERAKANGNSINEQLLCWIEWGIENDGHGKPSTTLPQGEIRNHRRA